MKRAIVTPAPLAPAALAELKDWLGITTQAEDAQLGALLGMALEACEGFTGAMPLQQECEELLPAQTGWQQMAARPVQAITAVQVIPAEGSRFALPADNYAIELGADGEGRVLVHNPGAAGRIAVRFAAGLAADWSSLPEGLRHGVLRLAAFNYRQREAEGGGSAPPAAIAALWRPWRRMRLA